MIFCYSRLTRLRQGPREGAQEEGLCTFLLKKGSDVLSFRQVDLEGSMGHLGRESQPSFGNTYLELKAKEVIQDSAT